MKTTFPSYLGYGKLIPNSIRYDTEKKTMSASYEMNGVPVLDIEINGIATLITEYYKEQIVGITSNKEFEKAVFSHYQFNEPIKSCVNTEWVGNMISIGNVYAEYLFKCDYKILYFPAVFLMSIRVPILDKQIDLAKKTFENPIIKQWKPWIQDATMITDFVSPKIEEPIKLINVICPIAFCYEIVKLLKEAGLIGIDKRYRAIVTAANPTQTTIKKTFFGRDEDGWQSYSILYLSKE
jgi:hypothetical protein